MIQSRHSGFVRWLLGWTDSNEFQWLAPLPFWYDRRTRALRRLRIIGRTELRREAVARIGWARILTQSVFWVLIALVKAVQSLHTYPSSAEGSGRKRVRAVMFRWWLQLAHNLRIGDQYGNFTHLPQYRRRPTAFMTCREHQVLLDHCKSRFRGAWAIERKRPFDRFCLDNELLHPEVLLTGKGEQLDELRSLPNEDLFLKLCNGGKGFGAEILMRDAGGWLGNDGSLLSSETQLAAYIRRRLGDVEWMIQRRIVNAACWSGFSAGALATMRVVTMRNLSTGSIECLDGYLRMPRSGASVDNISAGGVGTHVDFISSRLGPGFGWKDVWREYACHPDTGAPITGATLEGWAAVKRLALSAHAAAGDFFAVGWDITLTDSGPMLVEANLNWAILPGLPILDTDYVELMAPLFLPLE